MIFTRVWFDDEETFKLKKEKYVQPDFDFIYIPHSFIDFKDPIKKWFFPNFFAIQFFIFIFNQVTRW